MSQPLVEMRDIHLAFGLVILDVYGLTETGWITINRFDQRRAGSMGVPVPWYEVRILDENDFEVPVGERGDPRQVAGVFEQGEQQVEAGHER